MLLPNLMRRGAIISFTKSQFGFAHAKGSNNSVMKWMAQSRYNALNLNEILTPHKDLKLEHWTTYEFDAFSYPIHLALINYLDENKKFFGRIDFEQEVQIGFYSREQLKKYIPIKDKQLEDWFKMCNV
jgi:hypothetical protein